MMIIRRRERHLTPQTLPRDLVCDYQAEYDSDIVAVKLDNALHDLQTPVGAARSLEFVELNSEDGFKIYRRTVQFLLNIAVSEVFPRSEITVHFMVNKGLYFTVKFERERELTARDIAAVEEKMRELVAKNLPITKETMAKDEAARLFAAGGGAEKAAIIAALNQETVSVYRCGKYLDYFYGAMIGATGSLGRFNIEPCPPGLLLRTPALHSGGDIPRKVWQPKLKNILTEAKEWANILNCNYVTDLNRAVANDEIGEIIRVSEALHEKKIAKIAYHIAKNADKLRLILIAGPSSSGKTSFAQRLRIQLKADGLKPISVSLDDYFVNREDTPKNERGEYDYECLEALDTDLFNRNMADLTAGKTITPPTYNFVKGCREIDVNKKISVGKNQPIIIEGIHGLNDKLTAAVPRENKFKIYVSALTQLNIDAHNRIPTTEARLLRRLVRDNNFRGASAMRTLKMWPDVREGEEKHIFPFQEDADVMFNTALIYELGVLKSRAVALLESVPKDVPEYTRARQLLGFCRHFAEIPADEVPNNSILREFIGQN